jgi:hypothetical protein
MSEAERKKRNEQILADFKDKKSRYTDYWGAIYKKVEKHRRFTLLGEQLDGGEKSRMGLTNPLEPNLLLTYANHEANKTLQTDYKIKVTPNGMGADEVKARARQEVLRGLQRTNNITQVFNRARRDQVCGGIAYSIGTVDYAAKRGFGKTLKDEYLEDYQNVFPDINVKTPTFSDARDFMYRKEIPISDWKAETGQEPKDKTAKKKYVWYYWVREDVRDTEYLLADGNRSLESKLPTKGSKPDLSTVKTGDDGEPLGRPTVDYTWCWYKVSDEGDEIFDEEIWKGSYPPLVACTGRKVVTADGKVEYQPLTQFAEEAQKVYTILENIIALRLSKSPFSKWKVAFESINIKDMVTLRASAMLGDADILYKSLSDDGKPIPAPEEIEPHVLDAILITLQQEQERKIQRIFGIFDANLGAKSNEQSGIAIRERAQGGELSNYDLQFLYMEYVEQVGRVKMDLIPKYLTGPQQMAFVDEEDRTVMQWINTTGGVQFSPDEEYRLSVEAMPISQTAREDEAQALMDMAKISPLMAENPKVMALIAKSQPGRYSGQIAEILQGSDPMLQQAQQAIQELQGQLQEAQQKIAQDDLMIAGLKQNVAFLKQQQTMLKQMAAMEGNTEAVRLQLEEASLALDTQIREGELQLKAMDSESKRMQAEASMISAVDKASRPDPEPKEKKGPPA